MCSIKDHYEHISKWWFKHCTVRKYGRGAVNLSLYT